MVLSKEKVVCYSFLANGTDVKACYILGVVVKTLCAGVLHVTTAIPSEVASFVLSSSDSFLSLLYLSIVELVVNEMEDNNCKTAFCL